jgi:hypothetical protein
MECRYAKGGYDNGRVSRQLKSYYDAAQSARQGSTCSQEDQIGIAGLNLRVRGITCAINMRK